MHWRISAESGEKAEIYWRAADDPFVDRHGTFIAGTPEMTTMSRALIAFAASVATAVPAAAQVTPFRRFLAEGATGPFFATRLSLANPDGANPANVVLSFSSGSGTRRTLPVSLVPGGTAFIDVSAVSGFEASDVSTTIESDRLVVVDRMMEWGIDPATGHGYGSSLETATASPSPTWFLAEGSTVLGFDLSYLLPNPQSTRNRERHRALPALVWDGDDADLRHGATQPYHALRQRHTGNRGV